MKVNPLLSGAIAGFAATVPMTAVMLSVHRALPRHQRQGLQPRIITRRAARKSGLDDQINPEPRQTIATYTAHFGYGTTMGAVYAPLEHFAEPLPPALRGMTWGLIVWAMGYLGWLPLAGLHPPATREPLGREVMNVGSHIVWGVCVGLLNDAIQRSASSSTKTRRKGARHDASPAFKRAAALAQ